ncbi:MAG: CvpA family protein [Candidatus Eremiobacteraeota bacterium]|nr:CvpA family protein [Candidatus Eremiobacteraeota bacterium]
MSWLDLVLLLILGVLIFFSMRRGIIVEFFDILCILGAFCIGSFLKGPVAGLFMKQFDWAVRMANWVGFLLVAIPMLIIIFLIGSYINDTFKIKLPPGLVTWGGGVFGTIKAFLIAWIIMMLIASIPGVMPETRYHQGNGFLVRFVDSLSPAIEQGVKVLTPAKVGDQFIEKIELARYPETMEEAKKQYEKYLKEKDKDLKDKKKKEKK